MSRESQAATLERIVTGHLTVERLESFALLMESWWRRPRVRAVPCCTATKTILVVRAELTAPHGASETAIWEACAKWPPQHLLARNPLDASVIDSPLLAVSGR